MEADIRSEAVQKEERRDHTERVEIPARSVENIRWKICQA